MSGDSRTDRTGPDVCEAYRDLLSGYEAGELAAPAARRVETHLSACPACSRLLQAVRRTTHGIGQLADMPPSRSMSVRVLGQVDAMRTPDLGQAPAVMTPEDVARFLRVSPAALAEVIDTIPGFDIGGELRFRKERVEEWIQQRERDRDRRAIYSRLRAI